MAMTPKVSVIMPSLNVADYIEECMRSAMNQTLQEIEIISVDAGSSDGTVEILKKCAEEDERIRLLASDVKSYGRQVNMGIRAARGRYIAILETDDYIEREMYERLYEAAEKHGLDFIFADFSRFWEDEAGERYFHVESEWEEMPEVYGKVMETDVLRSCMNPQYYFLWRGIYCRDFLMQNRIELNETIGAAFQDIGFLHRVMMYATRGMYVPESYYRYRTGREGASVNSVNALRYVYQEYRAFFDGGKIMKGFEKKFCYFLAISFLNSCTMLSWQMNDWMKENRFYYNRIKEWISDALDQGILSENDFKRNDWKRLCLLLGASDEFKYQGNMKQLFQRLQGCHAVIFGAGGRGKYLKQCLGTEIPIDAICDNNETLWGKIRWGARILSLDECSRNYPDDVYVIAVKGCGEVIKNQLMVGGIPEANILLYVSDDEEEGD